MANIIEILYRDYIAPRKRMMLILFLLILFIIAGAYAYKWYALPKINKPASDDVANANRREKPVDVLLFSTDWCPHCIKAQPLWTEFSNKYNGKNINGYIINCININCTDQEDPDVSASIDKYGIEHYPTVKMLINKTIVDFEASVNTANLSKFVDTITNQ